MRVIIPILLLILSACEGGFQPIDAKKVLSSLEGPKIQTMQDTFIETAKIAEKNGNFTKAAQLYTHALTKNQNDIGLLLALGNSYRRSGKSDAAIEVFNAVIAKDNKQVEAYEGKGLALMAKGDFESPSAPFSKALAIDSTRWKTLNALGILFSMRGMQSEAQAYYLEASRYSADNPSILNNLGLSQALNQDFDSAISTLSQAFNKTLVKSHSRKRIDLNLSLVYAVNGRLDEAAIIAEQYFQGAVLKNNLGLYAHLSKDNQLAKTYLNMALTESKMFYEKAWDNLQIINSQGNNVLDEEEDEAVIKISSVPKALPSTEVKEVK